ncbi:MAG: hypothetical protein JWM11_5135 [Planctomycetaceae bacterium]|nr:hypothetical protein [Planctomycetaceae bacterium]
MHPDWNRIFPDADHRWIMGLRRTDALAEYFADADATRSVRAEREHWLAADPEKYAALLPEAESGLEETVELARELGAVIDADQSPFEQLLSLGRHWELDFVLMHPGADGVFRPMGGVVCFPSSWALRDKLAQPMVFVHEPVPNLNSVLGRQIDTFLTKQLPGEAWRRENWSLARDGNWNHHPSRPRIRLDATISAQDVWIRLEHQLLLKLPRSQCVFFGIRMDVVPLQKVIDDPQAAKRFARILSTIPEAAADYKGFATARSALIKLLDLPTR